VFDFRYGPVTSGLREAGCFHLYTYGERILQASVDIRWKQRQIEQAMSGAGLQEGLARAEHVCSNFGISHSVAFSRAAEMALDIVPGSATIRWRTLLLEAERIANHLYQIYRLSLAAAQKVLAVHLSALFENALRLNQLLTGSRHLLGINAVGSWSKQPNLPDAQTAIAGYRQLADSFQRLYERSLANFNYLDRLHDAGTLTARQAQELGLTGPSLRACGVEDELDAGDEHRVDLPVITQNEGDALARMEIRAAEIVGSSIFLADQLETIGGWPPDSPEQHPARETGNGCGVTNSPSGALAYYLQIRDNRVVRAFIFTPSYPGLHAVSIALEGLIFTDFPFVFDSFGVHFADAAR
jgi:Ni,Fe-hydrogenase III large subunit